jgi:hypothetical protein
MCQVPKVLLQRMASEGDDPTFRQKGQKEKKTKLGYKRQTQKGGWGEGSLLGAILLVPVNTSMIFIQCYV